MISEFDLDQDSGAGGDTPGRLANKQVLGTLYQFVLIVIALRAAPHIMTLFETK